MSQNGKASTTNRPRVLLIAYTCHPAGTMESRVGWHRALQAARRHDVWVLYGGDHVRAELKSLAQDAGVLNHLRFVQVPQGPASGFFLQSAQLFWYGYALWQRRAFAMAARLHKKYAFQLVHQVGFCGYREPGYAWRLGTPFVIGPVGGTHNFPLRFLGQIDSRGRVWELVRNVANCWQMRFRRRVRDAYRNAAAVMAANTKSRDDLKQVLGINPILQLETGIHDEYCKSAHKQHSGDPLRILWAGRFRSWKAFPILLRALAQLPEDVRYELRVLGEGPCQSRWQALARKLSIDSRIEWAGWPTYEETLPHYHWADVFAFTSLRDTSGTGLLESLAAGVPIVGLDHQGASDIMTPECAVPISVISPQQTIDEFASAITSLARRPQLLRDLSDGALRRAENYRWSRQGARMDTVYQAVINANSCDANYSTETPEIGDIAISDIARENGASGRAAALATTMSE